MLNRDAKNEITSFLEEKPEEVNVVVMPDFFFDRFIDSDCDVNTFSSMISKVASRKGGSIDDIKQTVLKGGNAINVASALASLEVQVTPIVCANRLGFQYLKHYLRGFKIDLSLIKIVKKASLTTALEFQSQGGKVNIMLRDLGDLADFGPSDLTDNDFALIENADYVCLFNWAGTKNHGTALAEQLFSRTKIRGRGKTYYDTADPTPNKKNIPELMRNVLQTDKIDILSLNENEATCYAKQLTKKGSSKLDTMEFEEAAMAAARALARELSARIDLHTTAFSATLRDKNEARVPVFKINALRATGAGDSWNAGNILGDAAKLSDEGRLALANAVSAYYLSSPRGTYPSRNKLIKFIRERPLRGSTNIVF